MRAEFWGNEIDSMGIFDPSTQRRTANITRTVLLPAAENSAPAGPSVAFWGLCAAIEKEKRKVERAMSGPTTPRGCKPSGTRWRRTAGSWRTSRASRRQTGTWT